MTSNHVAGLVCGLICFGFLGFVGLFLGAATLRAAVSLRNKLVGAPKGSPERVREPGFGKSMGVLFLAGLVNGIAGLIGGIVASATDIPPYVLILLAQLVAVPIDFLVLAALLTAFLPATFGRALLVTLFFLMIVLAILMVVVVILSGLSLLFYLASAR